jgi:hypothetical protein
LRLVRRWEKLKRRLVLFDENDGYGGSRKKIGFGWKRGCVCLNGEGDDDVGDE